MSNICDKLPEHERLRLIAMISDGVSWRDIGKEFAVSVSSIRRWAKANNFARSRVAAKRSLVNTLLQGDMYATEQDEVQRTSTISTGNPLVDMAAERDAKVGKLVSIGCIKLIKKITEIIDQMVIDPKDCNQLATAYNKSWLTYAHINKLNDAPQNETVITWSGTE